jgi:adenine-specific DNA-methyltransferase
MIISNAEFIFRTARNKSKIDEYQKLKKDVFHEFKNAKDKTYYVLNGEEVSFASDKIREIEGKRVPTTAISDIWLDIGINNLANEGGVDLENGKKPEKLLQRIIELVTVEGDLVLDYHAGSGTTLAVAHKMGRQYIGIEQLDYEDNNPESRLKNVIDGDATGISKSVNWKGGGEFVYMQLAKWNEIWIDKVNQAKADKALLDLWGEMKKKAFLSYRIDIKKINENTESFEALSTEDKKRFLIESLDMNFAYVNYSDIEDKSYNISKEDKKLNKEFYGRS